ncbi:glutamate--cysteine ligase regulatory subunit [Diprion similis]|uniref:glutamate--cysteine ligase regulatory subunit n=1 Tax=Diprion similis TaxID=362088 RepID=UPI001EF7EE92|nr:glutamate--cysteine ligase regulatory subunit [Diprion similis]
MLSHNILINTGNILSLNEVKKKAGQNPSDELIETLKITLADFENLDNASTKAIGRDDASVKDLDRKELKITVKVFISSPKSESLKEALDQVLNVLQTDSIEALVIAYSKPESTDDILTSLKSLWTLIEEYIKLGKLSSVGVSDVDTDVFIQLFQWANTKPNIVQINLATCCVVPPALQVFTKENDVQLLTHSDPNQILPKAALYNVFGKNVNLHWVTRYQVHVKCRGVLSTKGYLVYINKPGTQNNR